VGKRDDCNRRANRRAIVFSPNQAWCVLTNALEVSSRAGVNRVKGEGGLAGAREAGKSLDTDSLLVTDRLPLSLMPIYDSLG
jgi:hypothetical protein